MSKTEPDLNVLALQKGDQRYIFIFTDEQRTETLRTFGKYAADESMNFSWYYAAILGQRIRSMPPATINRISDFDD